jgi:predicted ATP-dependent endonuclease of OLD family
LRKAIWLSQADLQLEETEIEVAKIDSKNIWDQLKAYMPLYTLFQADRKNSDGDSEVQDPMRLAVKEILGDPSIQADLAKIAAIVKTRLNEVATQTLQKLSEMNSDIASSLNPQIPDSGALKWGDVFKNVSLSGDNDIPINKRGSGVKRLVLISFFRAEVERRRREAGLSSVVYAIEEPETSQHLGHQRVLIDALVELSRVPRTQIILTSHSAEIVKRLNFENIVLITGQDSASIRQVQEHKLPYTSLNEVNYLAFDEASFEYHNELYGYIKAQGTFEAYRAGKPTISYTWLKGDKTTTQCITETEYVRHQIHHPENTSNAPFTDAQLNESIKHMRAHIQANP